MFFMNEYLVAAFLSIAAFMICFGASLYFRVSLFSTLLRSSFVAFLFMFAGLFLGKILKNLVVEAFLKADEEKEKAEASDAASDGEEADDGDLDLE